MNRLYRPRNAAECIIAIPQNTLHLHDWWWVWRGLVLDEEENSLAGRIVLNVTLDVDENEEEEKEEREIDKTSVPQSLFSNELHEYILYDVLLLETHKQRIEPLEGRVFMHHVMTLCNVGLCCRVRIVRIVSN